MAKTIMSVLAFIAFGFSSHAQTGIASLEIYKKENESRRIKVLLTGKITDAVTGEALPGASIYIADIKLGTIADTGGKYSFRDIPLAIILLKYPIRVMPPSLNISTWIKTPKKILR